MYFDILWEYHFILITNIDKWTRNITEQNKIIKCTHDFKEVNSEVNEHSLKHLVLVWGVNLVWNMFVIIKKEQHPFNIKLRFPRRQNVKGLESK